MTGLRAAVDAWRGTILFLTGIGLIIYEAVGHQGPERWGLIVLYGGMVGLPVVIGRDVAAGPSLPPPPAPGPPSEATA